MHTQSNELKYLTFARFIFRARAKTVLKLPSYKGSTFRGGFGYNVYTDIVKMNPEQITIQLLTPFRFKKDGHFRDDFDFFDLFRNLLNRLYLLTYFHCGNRFDRDHRGLLEISKSVEIRDKDIRWHDWVRYSNRQKSKMKMGGVVGEFGVKGDLVPFLPFLKIGEYTNIGKATSMGLGKYEIIQ